MSEPQNPGGAPFDSSLAALEAGFLVGNGRFTLVRLIGRGGMGVVWLARDESLREDVALKFLPPEIRYDAVALDDLRRETARARKLTHPNIVRIHDIFKDDREAFISMEYVDGPNLSDLRLEQRERVFAWQFLEPLVKQLCEALDYAHNEKVVHRDIKPANMMLDSRGRLKLSDFGIAAQVSDSVSRVSMLRHGQSGTVTYMSPQQMDGKLPQVSDDIYALGATVYELLTSKPPFFSGDIAHQVRNLLPPPLDERLAELGIENAISTPVAALIMACLGKSPEQRPSSARAVAEWIGFQPAASVPAVQPSAPSPKLISSAPAEDEKLESPRAISTSRRTETPPPVPSHQSTRSVPPPISAHVAETSTGESSNAFADADDTERENSGPRFHIPWLIVAVAVVVVLGLGAGVFTWWLVSRGAQNSPNKSAATSNELSTNEFLKAEHIITGHRSAVSSVIFSPDQNFLISGSADGTVRVYETMRGELKWSANADVGAVNSVAVSRENKLLAVAGANGMIRLFTLSSGGVFQTLRIHSSPVSAAVFSPSGTYIASADDAGTLALWDYERGALVKHFTAHNTAIHTLAFAPGGASLASGGQDQIVRLWNVPDATLIKALPGHKGLIWSLAFSADGRLLASSSRDRSTRIWDTGSFTTKRTIQWRADANLMRGVAFAPDSKFLAGASPRSVKIFQVETAARGKERPLKATGIVRTVAFSPDGRAVASGGEDGLLHVWPFNGEALFRGNATPPPADDDAAEATTNASAGVSPMSADWTTIFNGRDLTGWSGDPAVWSVVNGVLQGRLTQKSPATKPSALFWRGGPVEDFELHFAFRLLQAGNSGVYYHAVELPNFDVGGYQFEIMRGNIGSLFETGNDRKRRDLRRVNAGNDRADEWHEATIAVAGHHITHSLDGKVLAEADDGASVAPPSGLIALEITTGPAVVDFKDIRIKRNAAANAPTPTAAALSQDWITLFDGNALDAWEPWRSASWVGAWEVLNGELRSLRGGTIQLATREQFGDFELELEWKATPGANSGVLYRALPSSQEVWKTAPEYQIVDEATADGRKLITATGSVYGVVPVGTKVTKPVGEWNSARIVARGSRVEHWVNGSKALDADLASPAVQRAAFQKFSKASWGEPVRGHIVLQHLGSEVSFRNIRVRKMGGD